MSSTRKNLKTKVREIQQQNQVIDSLKETQSQKRNFINTYGVQIEMSATYVYSALFHRQNQNYLFTISNTIFPEKVNFTDYKKLGNKKLANQEQRDPFIEKQLELNRCLQMKVYELTDGKFQLRNVRKLEPYYQNKICVSEDSTRLAIVRKSDKINTFTSSLFKEDQKHFIDIFDCSSIDFFLKDAPLSKDDQEITHKIEDKSIHSYALMNEIFMRFSPALSHLYLIMKRQQILIYKLESNMEDKKEITEAHYQYQLPQHYFEEIVNLAINDDEMMESHVAAKKSGVRSIEIFTLELLQEIKDLQSQESIDIKRKILKSINEFQKGSIKIKDYNSDSLILKFSKDHSKVLCFCSAKTLLITLKTEFDPSSIQEVKHLDGKNIIQSKQYLDNDFIVVVAESFDSKLRFFQVGDKHNKFSFFFRYTKESSQIRDLFINEDSITILVSRDDEEFLVYRYKNFIEKSLWTKFNITSNYAFEWPYIFYMFGQSHIIIRNAFKPQEATYIDMGSSLEEGELVSHLFLTENMNLFIAVASTKEYRIYEASLDPIMESLVPSKKAIELTEADLGKSFAKKAAITQSTIRQINKPIAIIDREKIGINDQIYRFYARDAKKSEEQSNEEMLIFFNCNYKIYVVQPDNSVKFVDTCAKFRQISINLIAYVPLKAGKTVSYIKLLKISFSDFFVEKLYEELDGKLLEFHIEDDKLYVAYQPDDENSTYLKILEIPERSSPVHRQKIRITHPEFLGHFRTQEHLINNCLIAGNNLFSIIDTPQGGKIHYYQEVLPKLEKGDYMNFIAPLKSQSYRKMVYFVSNKKSQKTKQAYVLPFINDHFVILNKRFNEIQISNFGSNLRDDRRLHVDHMIINILPQNERILRYSFSGQVLQIINLKKLYQQVGDKIVAVSPKGNLYLHTIEDSIEIKTLTIVKVHCVGKVSGSIVRPETSKNAKQVMENFITMMQKSEENEDQLRIEILEEIDFSKIQFSDEQYNEIHKYDFGEIVSFYIKKGCQMIIKINDNQDILVTFITNKLSQQSDKLFIKECFLLKKIGHIREIFKIRIENYQEFLHEQEEKEIQQKSHKSVQLKQVLLQNQLDELPDQEFNFYSNLMIFNNTTDVYLANEHVILWSKDEIYWGSTNEVNSNLNIISAQRSQLRLPTNLDPEKMEIAQIFARHQSAEDKINNDFFIVIKLLIERKYSFFMRYNLYNEKEFSSFDCSPKAQPFFDDHGNSFILESDSIIDWQQGVPLYFFKTGIDEYDMQYVLGEDLTIGSRFSHSRNNFIIKSKLHLPFSYFSIVLIQSNAGKQINIDNYDPTAFFCIKGQTTLHHLVNNYKQMQFVLNQYEISNPKLLNLLLLKNNEGESAFDIALKTKNSRIVNLILSKVSGMTVNNIRQVQDKFKDLLQYREFKNYLKLCFKKSDQMARRKMLPYIKDEDEDITACAHCTSLFDEQFYLKFTKPDEKLKPVNVKFMDAAWILRTTEGFQFLEALSEQTDMDYFQIETVVILVKFMWNKYFKWLIIKFLFIPFLAHFLLFNYYAINFHSREKDDFWMIVNYIVQGILLLFTFYTVYIEVKQIQYHKNSYFKSIWNLFDLSTVVITPLIIVMDIINLFQDHVRPLIAVCLIFFYLRFFYFLRIFDHSSHLVRTILEITSDIKFFLAVLMIGTIGFGACFYVLSMANEGFDLESESRFEIDSFYGSILYSYRLILGDFSVDGFNDSRNPLLLWLFFVLASLFAMIILLNMLIAIMGDSFNRVNETVESQNIREHLQMIVENDFLLNRYREFKKVKYIIAIMDDRDQEELDPVIAEMKKMKKLMTKMQNEMKRNQVMLEENDQYQTKQLLAIKSDIQSLKNHMDREQSFYKEFETEENE